MGLTYNKEEQLREQPIIKTRLWKSSKGDHIVFQTTITQIKPVAYMEKVMSSSGDKSPADDFVEAAV